MNDSERRAWLRLARTENVGPVTFRNLLARFGTASAALEELPRLAARGGNRSFIAAEESDAARELEALSKLGGRLITSCEAGYPAGLAALEAPPPVISILGHPHLLQKDMVAMVGARNASALARKFA
ncbi:MAG TPA: DNA-processing protein DprA, partial [Rhizomicrobium sp.]|nr:DNA-processing protein DprA [Rhizomicrobium sp.]